MALQSDGVVPAAGTPLDTQVHLQRACHLVSTIWQQLMEPLATKAPPGCGGPKTGLVVALNIVHELAAMVALPQWPAAELLLYVLLMRLRALDAALSGRSKAPTGVFGKEDRETLFELLGCVTQKVRIAHDTCLDSHMNNSSACDLTCPACLSGSFKIFQRDLHARLLIHIRTNMHMQQHRLLASPPCSSSQSASYPTRMSIWWHVLSR